MAQLNKEQLTEALKRIRLLLLDVDGVLTDGSIVYNDRGEEIKTFNVKDGLGLRLLMKAGIEVGIVTGRSSRALYHRCQNLGISRLHEGVRDKVAALEAILVETNLTERQVAFVADDLPDLPMFPRVGLAVAVGDASKVVREKAHWITGAPGGKGAVREVCELILKAQGRWQQLVGNLSQ
ncbi:MAG: HAD hydrolase family protein [Desulfobacterales bacterium]|jgi:3-deoxy-D-manno-octulosonate 8-phosphate phosphatase (KDO 8-P phosphatase)